MKKFIVISMALVLWGCKDATSTQNQTYTPDEPPQEVLVQHEAEDMQTHDDTSDQDVVVADTPEPEIDFEDVEMIYDGGPIQEPEEEATHRQYDVVGTDYYGNAVSGSLSMEAGGKFGGGFLIVDGGENTNVEAQWTGDTTIEAVDENGNQYFLNVQ